MGGDMTLKESREGLTVFAFKIPVKVSKHRFIGTEEISRQSLMESEKIPDELRQILTDKNLD